ncbi:MAG: hypothetical protein KIT18_10100 [Burkholderiales bacterium]|nr:hypothetical protein [Burkholderiales bacterium]
MAKWPDPDSEFEPEFDIAPDTKPAFDLEPDFEPLELKKPLARGKAPDLGDVTGIADALADLGAYDKGRHGNPPLVPETLFRSIEDFQKDHGLDVDGVMLPGGPTLGRINTLLPTARPRRLRSDFLQSEPPKPPPTASEANTDDTNAERKSSPSIRVWHAQATAPAVPDLGSASRPRGGTGRPNQFLPSPSLRTRPGDLSERRAAPGDRERLRGDRDVTEGAGENRVVPVTPQLATVLRMTIPVVEEWTRGLNSAAAAERLVEVIPQDGPFEIPTIDEYGNVREDTVTQLHDLGEAVRACLDRMNLRPCAPYMRGGPDPCAAGNCDYSQRGGTDRNRNPVPEQRIPPPGTDGAAKGSGYADLQIRFCRSNRRLTFNTQTTNSRGDAVRWEQDGESRLMANMNAGEILFLIAKPRRGQRSDFSGICEWLRDLAEELQLEYDGSRPVDKQRFKAVLDRLRVGSPYRFRTPPRRPRD